MKTTSEQTRTITLVMNEEEARTLLNYMQNPHFPDEDSVTSEFREAIWHALKPQIT